MFRSLRVVTLVSAVSLGAAACIGGGPTGLRDACAFPQAVCGEWEWMFSTGGQSDTYTPATTGSTLRLELGHDSVYGFVRDGELERWGRYTVEWTQMGYRPDSAWVLIMLDTNGAVGGSQLAVIFRRQDVMSLYEVFHTGRYHDFYRIR